MATIALHVNKINQMSGLIQDVKKTVVDYQSVLSALKKQSLKINQSICNLDDVISSIQASSQTQEQKIASLETFQQNSEQFIEETARIDSDVADVINQRKDDFYEEYSGVRNCVGIDGRGISRYSCRGFLGNLSRRANWRCDGRHHQCPKHWDKL